MEEWSKSRRIFIAYVQGVYNEVRSFLTPEFQKQVEENYMNCIKKLDEIDKYPYCEEAIQIHEMLNL